MNMTEPQNATSWNLDDARALYNIDRWGSGYYDINDRGHVIARPQGEEGAEVDRLDIIDAASERNLSSPLLSRFQDILRHRVVQLNESFARAIKEYQYQGRYQGVFPIKVNQLREVVEEVLDAGKPYHYGLEVGSKPELYAGLGLQREQGDLIICNGYKDEEFIRTALLGVKLNKQVIIVVEKMEELRHIIRVSREMQVEPLVGLRLRLHTKGAGKWAKSAGDNAKFGLSPAELMMACRMLQEAGLSHCFKLIHFHIGSQVPDITIFKRAVQEAARYYAQFYRMGFRVEYLDVGGGLGVDYDGSRTASESSMNYSLQEYANDVVYYIGYVCNAEKVPHPNLISESGRAVAAHHSVLVVEVFGAIEKNNPHDPVSFENGDHAIVRELLDMRDSLSTRNRLEVFHDARERREEAHEMFALGVLELGSMAKIDQLYWEISALVVEAFRQEDYVPEEIGELESSMSDQFLCNFSLFQSLLDHWALGQVFPVMPLSRLDCYPDGEAVLDDITCDSDGQINRFIDLEDVNRTLRIHKYRAGNDGRYFLGFFLMGAYQDIMGDLHNLFGRVNEIHVFLDPDEPCGYYVEEILEGTSIAQSLSYVQYDQRELNRQMKTQIDAAIKSDRLKPSEGMRLLGEYEKGLRQYTYLSFLRGT